MWLDITRPLTPGMPVYPGDPPLSLRTDTVEDMYRLSEMSLCLHCGTHVDAPAHFLPLTRTAETLSLSALMGEAQVLSLNAALNGGIRRERILLRADRGITRAEAEYLRARNLLLIGVDRMSVADASCERDVHLCLLGADVILLENIDLTDAPDGFYQLICAPLLIPGAEAAPARALLRAE